MGDYEHLGQHAGKFELANVWPWPSDLDMVWCKRCGVALCCCSPAVPTASVKLETGSLFGEWYRSANHDSRWLYGFRPGLRVAVESFESGTCAWAWGHKLPGGDVSWHAYARSKEEAMREAEAWGRAQLALRPGWTTDGVGYFNDAIALMVVRAENHQAWQVFANGEPWLQGKSFCTFTTLQRAMEWAEELAREYREDACGV